HLEVRGEQAAAEAELSKKSCIPCNSKDLHAMSEDSAKKSLEQVTGWELKNEGDILKLHRAWKVKNFVKGLEFFQLVAAVAEEEGSPPRSSSRQLEQCENRCLDSFSQRFNR
uniref:4a-hydroxytetrahydrobiopterin dehydratase n=1 Tax=Aegilops tauschii subsp. strangulata TaxID=200361 RepID=A0A453F6G2_AEGTS